MPKELFLYTFYQYNFIRTIFAHFYSKFKNKLKTILILEEELSIKFSI